MPQKETKTKKDLFSDFLERSWTVWMVAALVLATLVFGLLVYNRRLENYYQEVMSSPVPEQNVSQPVDEGGYLPEEEVIDQEGSGMTEEDWSETESLEEELLPDTTGE